MLALKKASATQFSNRGRSDRPSYNEASQRSQLCGFLLANLQKFMVHALCATGCTSLDMNIITPRHGLHLNANEMDCNLPDPLSGRLREAGLETSPAPTLARRISLCTDLFMRKKLRVCPKCTLSLSSRTFTPLLQSIPSRELHVRSIYNSVQNFPAAT